MAWYDNPTKLAKTVFDPLGIASDGGQGLGDMLGFGAGPKDMTPEIRAQLQELLKNYTPAQLEELKLQNPQWLQDMQAVEAAAPERVNAENVQAFLAPDSAMAGVSTDPRLRDAQLKALSQLQEVGDNGGMTLRDQANLSKVQGQVAAADRGRRDAIMQNMAARGASGGGLELIAQMQNAQSSTDREAQSGLDIAAQAQERALQAMMNSGQLGGSIRGQDFGEASQKAQAQDAISKFNAGVRNQTTQFNAGRNLDAAQFNSQQGQQTNEANAGRAQQAGLHNNTGRQQTANQGTENQNAATRYNSVELPQSRANNANRPLEMQADFLKDEATLASDKYKTKVLEQGDRRGQTIGMGTKIGTAMLSDKTEKKGIKKIADEDIADFIAALKPRSFEYKDEANGQGRRAGVMAQDIEKSKLGAEIVGADESGKKTLDTNKLIGAILASLKHISDKVG